MDKAIAKTSIGTSKCDFKEGEVYRFTEFTNFNIKKVVRVYVDKHTSSIIKQSAFNKHFKKIKES